MDERFEQLWSDYLEGDLDGSGFEELQKLLAADPQLLQHAADLYEEHRLLGLALQPFEREAFVEDALERIGADQRWFVDSVTGRLADSEQVAPKRASRTRFEPQAMGPRWLGYAAVALLAFAISWGAQQWLWHPEAANVNVAEPAAVKEVQQPVEYVATLVRCEDCKWDDPQQTLTNGRRLIPGVVRLESGVAAIQFDGGAVGVLSGPAELELESAAAAALVDGNITVRAPEEAAGFVLRTPASEILDLGTEFSVSVDEAGATEVHVTEGEVEWRKPGIGEAARYLMQGQAIRFDSVADREGRYIPLAARAFSHVIPRGPRRTNEGRLLAYEPFAYPFAVSATPERAADGGIGWASPWYCAYPTSRFDLNFRPEGSLEGPPPMTASQGGTLALPTEDSDRGHRKASKRQLEHPIHLGRDGVYYMSFLVRREAVSNGGRYHGFRWILAEPGNLQARLGFGMLSDGRPIVLGPAGNQPGSQRLRDEENYLFVGKLVCAEDHQDQMFLKIYGPNVPVDEVEPLQWMLVGRSADCDEVLSQLHIYNAPSRGYLVDEVRIGTSWEAVTPLANGSASKKAVAN